MHGPFGLLQSLADGVKLALKEDIIPKAADKAVFLIAPVIAVSLGVLVWGDRPGPKLWIGGAMVLLGVLIVAVRGAMKKRELPIPDAEA